MKVFTFNSLGDYELSHVEAHKDHIYKMIFINDKTMEFVEVIYDIDDDSYVMFFTNSEWEKTAKSHRVYTQEEISYILKHNKRPKK